MTDPMLDARRFTHGGFWAGFVIFALAATIAVVLASMTARVSVRAVVAEAQQTIH